MAVQGDRSSESILPTCHDGNQLTVEIARNLSHPFVALCLAQELMGIHSLSVMTDPCKATMLPAETTAREQPLGSSKVTISRENDSGSAIMNP